MDRNQAETTYPAMINGKTPFFLAEQGNYTNRNDLFGYDKSRNMSMNYIPSQEDILIIESIKCEKIALLDLHVRGYRRIDSLDLQDTMNIADALQSIFDFV